MSIPSLAGADETCWLLRVIPPDLQTDLDSRRTWRLMAQRVAHDLRNPLTSIRLALQSMQMDYREADPEITATLDAYVDQIEDQIESLRRTATNVMKLVGAEEQNVLETDLSSFLRRKGRQLAANLPDDVELREELAEDLPPVSVDREQMTSVLENLVYNAVEALPEGGTVTIQAQLARNLSFSTSEMPRDYVLVEVMDTGVGMDAATRARAFDPGFTTAGEGTGLGLAMVKQIVEAHDGQVELESEPDVGTDVRVYLPVARGA
jgi:signal transduction histidine kinase